MTNRDRYTRLAGLALSLAGLLFASSAMAAATSLQAGGRVLEVIQQTNEAGQSQMVEKIVPIYGVTGGTYSDIAAQSVGNRVASIQMNGYSDSAPFADDSAAINAVENVVGNMAIYNEAQQVAAVAKSFHVNSGIYTVSQTVPVLENGKVQDKVVSMTAMVQPNGSYYTPGFKISANSILTILHATYEQSKVANGLPNNWVLPGAGDIVYQLYTMNLAQPGSGLVKDGSSWTVTTNGQYDEPQSTNGQTVNEDAGLQAMIQQAIRPVMQQKNAQYALVDYGRTVQPVYTTLSNGQQVAQMAIRVSNRTIAQSCGAGNLKFKNSGTYGFMLNISMDRYLVTQQSYSLVNHYQTKKLSSPQSYSKTATVYFNGNGNIQQAFVDSVIDPFKTDKVYNYQNDTVNDLPASDYVQVAGLQTNGQGGGVISANLPFGTVVANSCTGQASFDGHPLTFTTHTGIFSALPSYAGFDCYKQVWGICQYRFFVTRYGSPGHYYFLAKDNWAAKHPYWTWDSWIGGNSYYDPNYRYVIYPTSGENVYFWSDVFGAPRSPLASRYIRSGVYPVGYVNYGKSAALP